MRRIVLLVAATVVAGCDGDGDGERVCASQPACGGDLVGTWSVQNACVQLEPGFVGCSDVSGIGTAALSGTITFSATGAYERHVSETVSVSARIPADCLPEGVPCSQLAASEGSGLTVDGCTGNQRVACSCRITASSTSVEQGTYSTGSNLLVTMSGVNDGVVSEYCVEGDVLTLSMASPSGWLEVLTAKRQ